MKRDYYILKSGRLKRKQNTLYLENKDGKTPIPVTNVDALYVFGELDMNTKLLIFISQNKIPIHYFNYYGFYSGTFYPREYLNSGFLVVKQVKNYLEEDNRLKIAKEIINVSIHNILKNLLHYKKQGKKVDRVISEIESEQNNLNNIKNIPELMGIEGRVRDKYYQSFNEILKSGFEFEKRIKRPPDNMINCLISFGNSMLYTTTLSGIYRTQLNPTISYLHEPSERRFSLSLDISEIFKPIIVDKVIFKLINNQMIKPKHFMEKLNYCYLNEDGRRLFISEYDERLKTTIKHKELRRNVSYKRLIRLECYKLIKHLIGEKEYNGFKAWW